MSSAASSSLSRILIGSLIGAVIGLILLALGVAILWNAADQRLADAAPAVGAPSLVAPDKRDQPTDATASPVPYPAVAPAPSRPPVPLPVAPPPPAATSIWRSIFDDGAPAEAVKPPPAPRAASTTASPGPGPRPAPRPTTPRRPPEAQRQDDSLFF